MEEKLYKTILEQFNHFLKKNNILESFNFEAIDAMTIRVEISNTKSIIISTHKFSDYQILEADLRWQNYLNNLIIDKLLICKKQKRCYSSSSSSSSSSPSCPRSSSRSCSGTSSSDYICYIGPTGPTGHKGKQGPKGDTGEKGDKGDKGDQGIQGIQGPTGPKGEAFVGSNGPTGPQGPTGEKGHRGCEGKQGEQGPTGPYGPTGPKGKCYHIDHYGPTGPQGIQGIQGIQGPTGPKGEKGCRGEQGCRGERGKKGCQGPTGYGPTGPTGPIGPAGGITNVYNNGLDSGTSQVTTSKILDLHKTLNYNVSNPNQLRVPAIDSNFPNTNLPVVTTSHDKIVITSQNSLVDATSTFSSIENANNASITASQNSKILGGNTNTITNGINTSIINSTNSNLQSSINFIGAVNENLACSNTQYSFISGTSNMNIQNMSQNNCILACANSNPSLPINYQNVNQSVMLASNLNNIGNIGPRFSNTVVGCDGSGIRWEINTNTGSIITEGPIVSNTPIPGLTKLMKNSEQGIIKPGRLLKLVKGTSVRVCRYGEKPWFVSRSPQSCALLTGGAEFKWHGSVLRDVWGTPITETVIDDDYEILKNNNKKQLIDIQNNIKAIQNQKNMIVEQLTKNINIEQLSAQYVDLDNQYNNNLRDFKILEDWTRNNNNILYKKKQINSDSIDPNKEYVPRTDRPEDYTATEWLGIAPVLIDNTVSEENYIISGDNGIGTLSNTTTRVYCTEILDLKNKPSYIIIDQETQSYLDSGYRVALCCVGIVP